MSFPLPQYATIKNDLCLYYAGFLHEHVLQLKMLRPMIERQLPGINIHLCVRDSAEYLVKDEPRIVLASQFHENRKNFAYIKNIVSDPATHPIWQMITESSLAIDPVPQKESDRSKLCLITSKGSAQTGSLTNLEIQKLRSKLVSRGFQVELDCWVAGAGMVAGVESEYLYRGLECGMKTALIPTGLGTGLYLALAGDAAEIIEVRG
jgi:hypothetical protein